MSADSARTTADRLRDHAVVPRRAHGQNFLLDPSLLTWIADHAELGPAEVVLEVGGGVGNLSTLLAERVGHLHVVEIDRGLEQPLREVLAGHDNVTLTFGDALKLQLEALEPAPTRVVANLPYRIAAQLLIETIERLPTVALWLAMTQLEVAERIIAKPHTRAYGVPSVLVQLACDARIARRVDRAVFKPRPRVDSARLRLDRTAAPSPPALNALVRSAFAHRRKALPRSLELALPARLGAAATDAIRERARAALLALGLSEKARAEDLTPDQFAQLAEALEL